MKRATTRLDDAIRQFDELGSSRRRDDRGYVVVRVHDPADPVVLWNAFVALLSHSAADELHPAQADAWWAFRYESCVQNGGHELFLDQYAASGGEAAVKALRALGAEAQAGLLRTALSRSGEPSQDTRDFGDLDAAFGVASPTIAKILEGVLAQRLGDFVEVA